VLLVYFHDALYYFQQNRENHPTILNSVDAYKFI